MIITEIKEVSLYRSGAYITRIGNVDLHAGKQTITIEGLTSTLEPSTLSVGLSDKVKGSNIRVEQLSAEDAKERKKELQSKLERIRKAIEVRNVQIDVLQGNTDFTSSDKLDLKDMADYIDALPERIEKIYRQIQDLKDEEAELAKQLKEKEKQLKAYLVKVDLETESDGSYPIQLRYYEYTASWNPFYEIHTAQDDQVSIRLKGKVRQNTIEDWKGVSLNWYLHYGSGDNIKDLRHVNELFDILQTVYPNVQVDSHDDRMEIIVDNFVDYIHMKELDPDAIQVSWSGAHNYLLSGLGFQEENKSHFRRAAQQCGYTIRGYVLQFDIK